MQRLEAVVLNTTSREIDSGDFSIFIRQFTHLVCIDMDFIININNRFHTTDINPIVSSIINVFNTISVNYLDIPSAEDVYISDTSNVSSFPKYGAISGPNIMFLFSMRQNTHYNTILLLECDCVLKKDFLTVLSAYTKHSGGFLIAGTTYDGVSVHKSSDLVLRHINGVALYNTGSSLFQSVINHLDAFIINRCVTNPISPYDMCITEMIFKYIDTDNNIFWKNVLKNIVKTNYFVNMSMACDADSHFDSNMHSSCVVLHKKIKHRYAHALPGFLI
jgi:hypothetical protein